MTLTEFINATRGKRIGVPWNENLTGQCVSLVQQYIGNVLGQPMKPRGNARDWDETYVAEGLGKIVKGLQCGDLIVYNPPYASKYGHIAIYIGDNKIYDQNNFGHDNGCAGEYPLMKNGVYIRPNVKLPIEEVLTNVDITQMANDVIAGKYGNGDERRHKLGNLYNEVQNKVNEILKGNNKNNNNSDEILELVRRTLRGDFGSGDNRKNILGKNYEEVQRQVNLNIKNKTTSWGKIKLY